MVQRILRVNALIKRELSQIILKKVEFPQGVLVTVTRVESAPNLITSKAYISSFPEKEGKNVIKILKNNIYDIQQIINRRLKMRPVPQIIFLEEKTIVQADKIEEILVEIEKKEKR